eukprot:comp19149_c0_seq1/m.21824 comp19149_c0_seq1/g.21824  ORF comp19149_c0_seq1/g.21824 comp19149_c0_seq1/m.21824 type:complete len:598 (-) comp19149_c0_seq1:435-2228(-)
MGRQLKKGTRGAATAYMSRTQALRKLQLSLPDFRRLCILKGIYPREPNNTKKLKSGPNATYYYTKDIQFLAHEPLLKKYREFKIFIRKLKKAVAKKDKKTALALEENAPVYSVDHLVKERYPAFIDAVRDLDDTLCMVFLFRAMPRSSKIKAEFVDQCDRLARELMHYVVATGALRKVFLSIKGIYYQADIMGQPVTWIVPYSFSQKVPEDVDFRVMLTFLEFYTTMLGFVNFRLYHSLNLLYPPKLDSASDAIGGGLHALVLEKKDDRLKIEARDDKTEENGNEDEEDGSDSEQNEEERKQRMATLSDVLHKVDTNQKDKMDEDDDAGPKGDAPILDTFVPAAPGGDELSGVQEAQEKEKEAEAFKSLFSSCSFYLSREVPYDSLEFVIRSLGGKVSWFGLSETVPGAATEDTPTITHQVVDRPGAVQKHSGRVYVQPQWVYDCVNARKLLPAEDYAPGQLLPPHLSPFVEAGENDYDPTRPTRKPEDDGEQQQDSDEEETYQREMEAESKGISFSEQKGSAQKPKKKSSKGSKEQGSDEEKELAKIMMSKKHRQLYNKITHGKKRKQDEVEKLEKRRAENEEAAAPKTKRQRKGK